jgi:hypothetical protein
LTSITHVRHRKDTITKYLKTHMKLKSRADEYLKSLQSVALSA